MRCSSEAMGAKAHVVRRIEEAEVSDDTVGLRKAQFRRVARNSLPTRGGATSVTRAPESNTRNEAGL
jgi:hypothetical protein